MNQKIFLVECDDNNLVRRCLEKSNSSPKLFEDIVALQESAIQHYIKNLTGKIFTMLDASVVNDRQLKSMKDILRNAVADTYGDISNMCWDGAVTDYCNDLVKDMSDDEFAKLGSVDVKEVVGL